MDIKKEYSLKELIKKNNLCETINNSNVFSVGSIFPNNKISCSLSLNALNDNNLIQFISKSIELISNPIIIFELDDDYNLEFDLDFIFDFIELSIGGNMIDKLYNEQIKIYNNVYGLEAKKIGSKVFYPIPFASMNFGNGILFSKCTFQQIRLTVKFAGGEFIKMIKSSIVQTELTLVSKFIDYSFINNYFYSNNFNLIDNYFRTFDPLKNIRKHLENSQFVKFKQNQFDRIELLNNTMIKKIVYFNHNVERFFIYFQNVDLDNNSIYCNTQQFETIKFIADGCDILELDYEQLLNENSKSILGYDLPKGVFEIKWNINNFKNFSRIDNFKVELNGLMVPSCVEFVICAESINWLYYKNNFCSVYFSN